MQTLLELSMEGSMEGSKNFPWKTLRTFQGGLNSRGGIPTVTCFPPKQQMATAQGKHNVDLYNNLTMEELKQGVDQIHNNSKKTPIEPLNCIVTTYKYDKRPQVRINGHKFYCAIIVKLYQFRVQYGEYRLKESFDASHFVCHNKDCVEPKHIHFEDHRVNKSRLACRIYGLTAANYNCPHLPRCTINEYTRLKI